MINLQNSNFYTKPAFAAQFSIDPHGNKLIGREDEVPIPELQDDEGFYIDTRYSNGSSKTDVVCLSSGKQHHYYTKGIHTFKITKDREEDKIYVNDNRGQVGSSFNATALKMFEFLTNPEKWKKSLEDFCEQFDVSSQFSEEARECNPRTRFVTYPPQ